MSGEQLSAGERDLVHVHTVENRFEADLLIQALHQEEIPVLLRCFEETAYDGLFVTQMGWGALLVPEEHALAARDIVRGILESAGSERRHDFRPGGGDEKTG